MENDDRPVGRLLTRREVLALIGSVGAGLLVACTGGPSTPAGSAEPQVPASGASAPTAGNTAQAAATQAPTLQGPVGPTPTAGQSTAASTAGTAAASQVASLPACIARPEQTEGPYFRDEKLNRSDIRSDPADGKLKEGIPLALTFRVSQLSNNTCAPLASAIVDVWHCDAQGIYSDVTDRSFSTEGKKFLRGYQTTDAGGVCAFQTIYPGWYPGRTVHIHFKIRSDAGAGKAYEFTSQLYFDDALSDHVFAQPPYNSQGQRGTRNAQDGIFRGGGDQLLLAPTPDGQGYAAVFDIALQL